MKYANQHFPPLRFLAAITIALFCTTAHGIVNIEQAIIGQPAEGVHATLDLMASGTSGNSDKSTAKADLLTLWQHDRHTEYLQMQYMHGTSRGEVDTDKAFVHMRHRTQMDADWGLEGFAQVSRDPFARLTRRTVLGGGARRILFEEQDRSAGYFGLGAFHEEETLTPLLTTNEPAKVDLWRINSYLILKYQVNDQVRIYNTLYYQPATSDKDDFRILEQASLLVKMADNLDLKLSLDVSFDSRPPETVQQRDLFYSTGLSFSF